MTVRGATKGALALGPDPGPAAGSSALALHLGYKGVATDGQEHKRGPQDVAYGMLVWLGGRIGGEQRLMPARWPQTGALPGVMMLMRLLIPAVME